MMAASLLHRGVSVLKGCPRIADVFCMEEILQKLGAVTWWEDHDLYMDCENAGKWSVPFEFTGRMRSSVILLGALLARNGKGSLGYPGGCVIGKRPIDMHLFVLRKLGAVVTEEQGVLMAEAPHLQGALVSFSKRSVGATQQCLQRERLYWKIVPVSRKYSGFAGICVPWEQKYRGMELLK